MALAAIDYWPRKAQKAPAVPVAAFRDVPGYKEWLRTNFPDVAGTPLAPHHDRLWEWVEALEKGKPCRPYCAIWARGGAKSSTAEMACALLAQKKARGFCLYVSGTKEQAIGHVQNVMTLLESLGIDRLQNQFGNSKGWRRDLVRTSNGFSIVAIGLDVAVRGVKMDQARPDLIILDDIDDDLDSPLTIDKKHARLTSSILPSGSSDVAVLAIQNLIRDDGIFAKIVAGDDLLANREFGGIVPAVEGLKVEAVEEGGANRYQIVEGTPTWEGQDLATCEKQIAEWTLSRFMREAQHDVQLGSGLFFDVSQLGTATELPLSCKLVRGWDLASTEGGGDFTASVLVAVYGTPLHHKVYVVEVTRGRYGSDKVAEMVYRKAEEDAATYGRVGICMAQDPGQAGKDQASRYKVLLGRFGVRIVPETGSKDVRARGIQDRINSGNVAILDRPWPDYYDTQGERPPGHWARHSFVASLRGFREDLKHSTHDDEVDAFAKAYAGVWLVGAEHKEQKITWQQEQRKRSEAMFGRRSPR